MSSLPGSPRWQPPRCSLAMPSGRGNGGAGSAPAHPPRTDGCGGSSPEQLYTRYDIGLPPATAGAFGEGHKVRVAMPHFTEGDEGAGTGEPMSERDVHGAARTS